MANKTYLFAHKVTGVFHEQTISCPEKFLEQNTPEGHVPVEHAQGVSVRAHRYDHQNKCFVPASDHRLLEIDKSAKLMEIVSAHHECMNADLKFQGQLIPLGKFRDLTFDYSLAQADGKDTVYFVALHQTMTIESAKRLMDLIYSSIRSCNRVRAELGLQIKHASTAAEVEAIDVSDFHKVGQ